MKLNLRTKMFLAFSVVLVLMVLMAGIIIVQMNAIIQIAQRSYVNVQTTDEAITEALRVRQRLLLLVDADSREEQLRQLEQVNKHSARVLELVEFYEPLIESEGSRAAVSDFYGAWTNYTVASDDVAQLVLDGQNEQASLVLVGQAELNFQEAYNMMLLIQDIEDNQHRAEFFEAQATFQRAGLVAVGISIVTIIVGLGLAFWLSTNIAVPMAEMAESAQEIAEGDLNQTLPVDILKRGDEVGVLAQAFDNMTEQVRDLVGSLEQRVADRTEYLEVAAVLGERLSAILDLDQLLQELVNQVKDKFDYYHAHVYLLDESRQNLVMTAGSGEAGKQMKAQGHSIPYNASTSLVARAARTGEIVTVDNVREAEDWLPNPLLPDTYTEMAVPIILEGQIVGVLDVQENKIAGLDEGDADLLRSLANQVAVAIRNARLFDEVETALAEARAAQERYVSQSWQATRSDAQDRERLYIQPGMAELSEATFDAAKEQALVHQHPAIVPIDEYEGSPKPLVAPVSFAGQTIGALQLHKLDSEDTSQLWTEQDLEFVETILDQVALTAENLRLFEETRDRASREQLIGQVSDRLRRVPDMEALMKAAVGELSRVLGSDRAFIRFGSEAELGVVAPVNGPAETEAGGQDTPEAAAESDDNLKRNGS